MSGKDIQCKMRKIGKVYRMPLFLLGGIFSSEVDHKIDYRIYRFAAAVYDTHLFVDRK